MFEKQDVQVLINQNSPLIDLIPVDRSNPMWNSFNFIRFNSKKFPNFILCNLCRKVFCYDPHSSSSHSTHKKACESKSINKNKSKSVAKLMYNKLDLKSQKELDRRTAYASALDLISFRMYLNEGYLQLAQFLINISSSKEFGRFNLRDYSPHPSTISSNLNEIASEIKLKLVKIISELDNCSAILDHWSNRFNQVKFIGICIR